MNEIGHELDCGCELCEEVEANRCYFCGVSDPSHDTEDCADFAMWEKELLEFDIDSAY